MRVSSIIPTVLAALLPVVAATECEFYKANNPEKNEPLYLALRCPPPASLEPGVPYSEAVIDTNKCLLNHLGALVPYANGNAWNTCDGSAAVKYANGTIANVICAPATTATHIDIRMYIPSP
ncbi:uncharacterized protein N7459_006583 [Penicillium hispanicum]|uniref:uncharacterized protein n=1 Tax=Penicillium hispanicum TaxID=1080232 RepID=UPI00253FAE7C|nr:uncharacterized protein N7459_006583 [Penicillium hispanicum]KAJ5577619.1 hypothetical protein N7459_006583 [Penicillium hispanicum]